MLYLYIPYIPYTCYIENPRSPAPGPGPSRGRGKKNPRPRPRPGQKNVPRPIPTADFMLVSCQID